MYARKILYFGQFAGAFAKFRIARCKLDASVSYTDGKRTHRKKESGNPRESINERSSVGFLSLDSIIEFNLKFGTVVRIPPQLISRSSHTYTYRERGNVKIAA